MYVSTFLGPSAATATQDGPLIDQCLELAERCAGSGFAMVTFGEQHSNNYEPYCNPLLMAARLSPVLGDTWFGTTVIPLPFHSVLRLAEDSSVIDVLLRGRFVMGMSAGLAAFPIAYRNFGVDADRRQEIFTAKLDLLTRAYRQKAGHPPLIIDTGWDHETMGGRLMPAPYRDGGPQLAVGTNTPATVDDVAARGLALFLGPCTPPEAADLLARHRRGLTEAGRTAEQIEHLAALSMVTRQVIVGPTEDDAWDAAELMGGTSPLLDRSQDTRTMRELAAVPAADLASDPFPRNVRHVQSWFLAGTPDSVTEQLQVYDTLGVQHVNTRFTVGTYRPELVERSFGLFTKEVLPALRPQLFLRPDGDDVAPEHRPDADVFAAPAPPGATGRRRPRGPADGMTATMPDGDMETSFRSTMASVATPVCVVTTVSGGRPHGTTVSAFASLSLRPSMVLVALDTSSRLLARLAAGARFGINVLADRQDSLAAGFATAGQDRFVDVPWTLVDGAPRLDGPGGWFACDVADLVPGGDHVVVLGSVLAARPLAAPPLTYHLRAFGTHHPLSR